MSGFDWVAIRNAEGQLIGLRPPAPPRFRYFQKRNGPMFGWTTERFEDRYASFVHVPVGPGSRSGKAEEWQLDEDSIAAHELRRDAKARALRLYEAWLAGDPKPWCTKDNCYETARTALRAITP